MERAQDHEWREHREPLRTLVREQIRQEVHWNKHEQRRLIQASYRMVENYWGADQRQSETSARWGRIVESG
jgi:hypothetical protein